MTPLKRFAVLHSEANRVHNQLSSVVHGEGNGTPLQYSCLENPTDRGAWWAVVHGVAKSRTRLSDLTWLTFSCSFVSNSLQPHGMHHTRPLCPSPTPGAYSNSSPLSQWCHPAISSSVNPFSSSLQTFQASGYFPISQFFASGGKILDFQLQHQSFQWILRTDFL